MIKLKLLGLYILLQSLLPVNGFKGNKHPDIKITKEGNLPAAINESSGLEIYSGDTLITHNDGGGSKSIFTIRDNGQLLEEIKIKETENIDWEDVSRDNSENLFIGDIGNNSNKRKNLTIYRYNLPGRRITGEIKYSYPDQKSFPPARQNKNFDCEAMFWHEDSLYLFSKNRGNKWVKLYRLPDQPGSHTAVLVDSIKLPSMVTAADIAPDRNSYVLLAYGKLYFFKIDNKKISLKTRWFSRRFSRSGQAEAITYINNSKLVVTNEKGNVFHLINKRQEKK